MEFKNLPDLALPTTSIVVCRGTHKLSPAPTSDPELPGLKRTLNFQIGKLIYMVN
jgi:hypothetical protein